MRVRHLISDRKIQSADTGWRADDMPPRACPIYTKTRPIRAGWQWRSASAESSSRKYLLIALVNANRGNWQSFLLIEVFGAWSVVARFEFHASHPGVHIHSHCGRSGVEVGATGLDQLARAPAIGSKHRRVAAFTPATFWQAARSIFRIHDDLGPLYNSIV